MNAVGELLFYTPQDVAAATVDGILKNKKYVVLPPFLKTALTITK